MAVTPKSAVADVPFKSNISLVTASGTGVINVGDWLQYSGQFALPGFSGQASTAYWKNSGAGIALESNPMIDRYGNSVQNSGIKILVQGILRVSANFSGQPALGVGAYPDATGSAVGNATGVTGVGATWQTAAVISHSADPTAAAAPAPVATVIGSTNFSNGGTGELDVRLLALAPDVR